MLVTVTQHAVGQVRVRAAGPLASAGADEIAAVVGPAIPNARRIRDTASSRVFLATSFFRGRLVALVAEDAGRFVVVTVLTRGQFDKSTAVGKFIPEAA